MNGRSSVAHGGVLAGLAVLATSAVSADDLAREQIHRQYKHRSYMLVEDEAGLHLYLFGNDGVSAQRHERARAATPGTAAALDKLRSPDARTRVRGLTELAGVADPLALDAALVLMTDPSAAVRAEAAQLLLDHPDGEALADSLGLADEDEED